MNFIEALKITEGVFAQYKVDQLKWWKRLDGTPMLNALAVRFAEAMVNAAPQVVQPSAEAKITVAMPANDKRRIIIVSDEYLEDENERLLCVAIEEATPPTVDHGMQGGVMVALRAAKRLADRSNKIDRMHVYGRAIAPYVDALLAEVRSNGDQSQEPKS